MPLDPSTAKTDQSARATSLRTSAVLQNSIGMKFALIPAGEFMMGSPASDGAAGARRKASASGANHPIVLPRPPRSYPGRIQGRTGRKPKLVLGDWGWPSQVDGQSTDRHPVEYVSWLDSVEFCNKLSKREGLRPFYEVNGNVVRVPSWQGPAYRLPTEAEWEYACRENAAGLNGHAWYWDNSHTDSSGR